MGDGTRYLGLDVHAETITAAIAEGHGWSCAPTRRPTELMAKPRIVLLPRRQRRCLEVCSIRAGFRPNTRD